MSRVDVGISVALPSLLHSRLECVGTLCDAASADAGLERDELAGLLAMKLAYDVALSRMTGIRIDWSSFAQSIPAGSAWEDDHDEVRMRFQLLRASEIHFRKGLTSALSNNLANAHRAVDAPRKLAQMVFCIDVRSERMRRHLESVSNDVQTFGFAGFFGMPFEYIELGSNTNGKNCGDCQVPVLLKPQFHLHEGLNETNLELEQEITRQRGLIRLWRKCWKAFQESAISCFSFVESIDRFMQPNCLQGRCSLLARPKMDDSTALTDACKGI